MQVHCYLEITLLRSAAFTAEQGSDGSALWQRSHTDLIQMTGYLLHFSSFCSLLTAPTFFFLPSEKTTFCHTDCLKSLFTLPRIQVGVFWAFSFFFFALRGGGIGKHQIDQMAVLLQTVLSNSMDSLFPCRSDLRVFIYTSIYCSVMWRRC